MTLAKLYLLWLVSLIISIGVGSLYVVIGMKLEYDSLSCGNFECLPYVVYGSLIIFASTGIILSLLAYTFTKKTNKSLALKLSRCIALLYGAIFIITVLTTHYTFMYINPLGFIIFILLPFFAWESTRDKRTIRIWLAIFVLLAILLAVTASIVLYNINSSGQARL